MMCVCVVGKDSICVSLTWGCVVMTSDAVMAGLFRYTDACHTTVMAEYMQHSIFR